MKGTDSGFVPGRAVSVRPNVVDFATRKPSVLTPDMKAFIDRVVVPALVREYLAQEQNKNSLAPNAAAVENSARSPVSAEESTR